MFCTHTLFFFKSFFIDHNRSDSLLFHVLMDWIFFKSAAKKIHLYFSGQNESSRYFIFSNSSTGLAIPQFTFFFTFINTQAIVLKVNFIERFLILELCEKFHTNFTSHEREIHMKLFSCEFSCEALLALILSKSFFLIY